MIEEAEEVKLNSVDDAFLESELICKLVEFIVEPIEFEEELK